jgi:hypothetical protein
VATVVRGAHRWHLPHEVVVRHVDVLTVGSEPGAIVLRGGLGPCVEGLAVVSRHLDGRPGHVEIVHEHVAVGVHSNVRIAPAERPARVEGDRLRPGLAKVVGVPLEWSVGIADGHHVVVVPARGGRGVDRDRGLAALPTRQDCVRAEGGLRGGPRRLCAHPQEQRRTYDRGHADAPAAPEHPMAPHPQPP